MKEVLLSLIFFIGIFGNLRSQQDPQYTMFYFNKMLYNPAYAGAKDAICATMLGRSQWNGMPGAPNTWLFTADMPIALPGTNNQLGVGITTYGDYLGYESNHGVKFSAAFRKKNVGPGHLAIGVDIGFANKKINSPSWICPNGLNSSVDPTIPTALSNGSFGFDMGAGVYYHNTNFYVGVSLLHLTASNFSNLNTQQARHMYITGGYTFPIGGRNSSWRLSPNAIIRTDFSTANFDINLNTLHDIDGSNGIFFGATYRYIDAVGINVGYTKSLGRGGTGMLIGYNYDINTSRLSGFNSGTHEIILRFCFKIDRGPICTGGPIWLVVRYGDTMKKRY